MCHCLQSSSDVRRGLGGLVWGWFALAGRSGLGWLGWARVWTGRARVRWAGQTQLDSVRLGRLEHGIAGRTGGLGQLAGRTGLAGWG